MRGLTSFMKKIDLMKDGETVQSTHHIETQIRLEICKLIEYFMDMRQDYLITNFLAWYHTVYHSLMRRYKKKIKKYRKKQRKNRV